MKLTTPCIEAKVSPTERYARVADGRGGYVYAHRLAYEEAFGEIPDGEHVLHHCDNPPCVNPGHLFTGTQADNMRDMAGKGRAAKARAVLTKDDVLEIRSRFPRQSKKDLADLFGVSHHTIHHIVYRRSWKDVP